MIKQPIIILGGPTASGKSQLATVIAKKYDGVIINGDSMQIYREIPIVSAQPDATEMQDVPHELYGVLPSSKACSVARWIERVLPIIDEVHNAGKMPIIVGGTGLYLKSLVYGISPIPSSDPDVRQRLVQLKEDIGNQAFHKKLGECDPIMAERLHPNDSQRMIRAMEIWEQTGISLAEWQKKPAKRYYDLNNFKVVVLNPDREKLYNQCDKRFHSMMDAGALDEILALNALNLNPTLPAMKALGVPELLSYVLGNSSMEEAISSAQQSTRNYAKRQVTWFTHQFKDALHLEDQDRKETEQCIIREIEQFLLTL